MRGSAANFDSIARPYRWLEYVTFGPILQQVRTHFLPRLVDRHHALLFGDGDGRFLAQLFHCNSQLRADAVDTSEVMLRLLRGRVERVCSEEALAVAPRVRLRTHARNALDYLPDFRPDLVVTHFFLDCLTQPEVDRLIRQVAPRLLPGALWAVSDFRVPAGLIREPAALLVRALYFGFRALTGLRVSRLPNHSEGMKEAGLVRIASHERLFGILISELWQAPEGKDSLENRGHPDAV